MQGTHPCEGHAQIAHTWHSQKAHMHKAHTHAKHMDKLHTHRTNENHTCANHKNTQVMHAKQTQTKHKQTECVGTKQAQSAKHTCKQSMNHRRHKAHTKHKPSRKQKARKAHEAHTSNQHKARKESTHRKHACSATKFHTQSVCKEKLTKGTCVWGVHKAHWKIMQCTHRCKTCMLKLHTTCAHKALVHKSKMCANHACDRWMVRH